MRTQQQLYKGFDIYYDTSAKHWAIESKTVHTQLNLYSLKACKNVIDTYEKRTNAEVRFNNGIYYPPISEEKLNEVIERPKAEYSNKNHNQ